jgi:hypothetical protein
MSLYMSVTYSGDWWGEDPLTETVHETTGELFRALNGQDHARPWESLGRCTGRIYRDGPDGSAVQVGWVFVSRNPEPERRGDTQPTGRREAWVSVYTAPPTVTTVHHPASFGRVRP